MVKSAIVHAPRGLTHMDCSVVIRLAQTERWAVSVLVPGTSSVTEHTHLVKICGQCPAIALASIDQFPRPADAFFFHLGESPKPNPGWFKAAGRVIGISSNDFSRNAKAAAGTLWRTFGQAFRSDMVLAESRSLRWNPYRFWKRTVRFEPNVHPNYWLIPEWVARIAEPPPGSGNSSHLPADVCRQRDTGTSRRGPGRLN
jgi:hypothetical protein